MRRTVVGILGVVVLFAISYLTFYQASPVDLAFNGEKAFALGMVALTAVVMLLGILFGCLYRRLSRNPGKVDAFKEFKEVLSSGSFLSALCVSPFVFFAVYAIVKQRPGDPASLLLAFENGFFCESIFQRMFPRDTPTQSPAVAAEPKSDVGQPT
jgi:heme/copper-type cytochrome/quinol oxidase subunit 1